MVEIRVEIDSEEYCYKECSACSKEFDINSYEPVFFVKMDNKNLILCNECRQFLAKKLLGSL